jgi:hypothetical protein
LFVFVISKINKGLNIMKILNLLFLTAILFSSFTYSSAQQLTFQKTYGGTGIDQGHSIRTTFDGGYIITGYTQSYGAGGVFDDVYLIKTDVNGDTLWTKTYGGTVYSDGYSVEQTSDSGYVIAGSTDSFGNGGFDVYLIRTDKNGDTLWTKTYGGINNDEGFSVQQTTDGGFIIAGATVSFGSGNHDVYLIKTDFNGELLWTKTFGGTGDDYGFSVKQTNDEKYLVVGNHSTGGVYLIKTNESGDTLWTKSYIVYGPPHINLGYSMEQTADNGYIIAGTASSETFLLKTDSIGSLQWTKMFGGESNDIVMSVHQNTDGGYILGGWSQSFPVGSYHSMLIRTNAIGDTLWTRTYGGGGTPRGYSVQQAKDGGFIFLASASAFGAGNYDLYLVKTDSNGNSGCNEGNTTAVVTTLNITGSTPAISISSGGTSTNPATVVSSGCIVNTLCTTVGVNEDEGSMSIPEEYNLAQNYPNPFNPSTTIHFSVPSSEFVTLKVFDVIGNEVATLVNEEKPAGSYEVNFSASQLSSGIYFYKLQTSSFVETRKMILLK